MTMYLRDGVYLADTARVMGEVTLGGGASVWYSAVIRGDVAPIEIGEGTNVQDSAMVHCDSGVPNVIGKHVTIGHNAVVHGVKVGDGTLIGMHATVLGGTQIGKGCLIAAGALVPPGLVVPDGMVVMGVPGKIVRETSEKEKAYLAWLWEHYMKLARRHYEQPNHAAVRQWRGNGANPGQSPETDPGTHPGAGADPGAEKLADDRVYGEEAD